MDIKIRSATVEDAHAIYLAQKEIACTPGYFCSSPNELSEQNVRKTIEILEPLNRLETTHQGIYLVAENEGYLVGHAFLEPLPLQSICHVAELTIVVHEGWQEKGIGMNLMRHLIDWAKQSESIEKIELNVRASNIRAISLYKKMGFMEEGRLKNRVKISSGHYIDDILMAFHIKSSL